MTILQVVRFDCFQTHWIKGDADYKCGIVADYNDPTRYRFEWNKGAQPWCRSREMDNFLKYLVAILGTVFGIIVMIFIFLACWCVKQKRLGTASVADSSAPIMRLSPASPRKIEHEEPSEGLRQRAVASPASADDRNLPFMGLNTNV